MLSRYFIRPLARGARLATKDHPVRTSSVMSSRINLPPKLGTGENSVWVEYVQLVSKYNPKVNLGQGFPDYPAPEHVRKALAEVAMSNDPLVNQYTRGFGHPPLVKALAKLYGNLIGREIDPFSEVLVSTGAYEALFCAILGHVDVGDEVIVIEPFYDCYSYQIKMAGATPRYTALQPRRNASSTNLTSADWVLDRAELESLFNSRTKMLILNTPHNPLGKVFTLEELQFIAELCKKHNVICLSDEVYEWLVYEPHQHIRIATLPGMWERTVTVGSAGKTFNVTGWKVGWAYGPANLMKNLQIVHQNSVYTNATPLQEALARAIEIDLANWGTPKCSLTAHTRVLQPKREAIIRSLRKNGFNPTVPDGGYFVVADWRPLANKLDLSSETDKYMDYRFTKKFAKESGVLAIPPTAFYSEEHKPLGENYARFCFIKRDENLALADELMTEWHLRKITQS